MTKTEQIILKILKENPLISQQDLASRLNIKRSSVGVHIANLKSKGKLLGMGYIFPNSDYVTVIGGANIDFVGYPNNKIIKNDSNIGVINTSIGGVARNISENLAKLSIDTKLIVPIGDDENGKLIIKNANENNIDISNSIMKENSKTAIYLALLDEKHDMIYAISDMDIMNSLKNTDLEKKRNIIKNSSFIILDANLNTENLSYIFSNFENKIIVDTVSTKKAIKFSKYIDKIYLIKPNIYELEALVNIKIENEEDIDKAAKILIDKGLKHLVITLGEKGVIYYNKKEKIKFKTDVIEIKNATGAGDAFIAGLTYALMENLSMEKAIIYGMSAAKIALSSNNTVSKHMNTNQIIKNIGGIEKC